VAPAPPRQEGRNPGTWAFTVAGRSAAPPTVVWRLVAEVGQWRQWAGVTRAELERRGDLEPEGVGAVRRLGIGPAASRERVVVFEPPQHFGYVLVSGFPARNYRADVVLAPDGTGTGLTWSATFDPLVPGTGRLVHGLLRVIVTRFIRRLCRYADTRADTAAPAAAGPVPGAGATATPGTPADTSADAVTGTSGDDQGTPPGPPSPA